MRGWESFLVSLFSGNAHQLVIVHEKSATQRPVGILSMRDIVREIAK